MNRLAGALLVLAGTLALAAVEAMAVKRSTPDYLVALSWLEIAVGGYLLFRGERDASVRSGPPRKDDE